MDSVVAEHKGEQLTGRPLPVLASAPSTGGAGTATAAPAPVTWAPALCLLGATATAALVGIPVGMLLGYWSGTGQMAEVPWVGLVQAHGQTQLFGWLGLAILGVTFHAMAHLFRAAEPPARAAVAALALQLTGVVLRLAAPLVPGAAGGAWVLVGAAVAFLGAFGITLEAHARTLSRRPRAGRAPAVLPRYLLTGVLLWLVALLANLDGAIAALRFGPVAPGALDATRGAFIVAAATGGFALIAAGMSLRVVVGWLDLPPPDLRRASQAWWPLAGAALLRGLAPVADASGAGVALDAAGALLWAAGVAWYLPALHGLWSPEAVRIGGGARGEADPPLAWFVRTAYAWFALSGLLALAHAALLPAEAAGLGGLGGAVTATGVADAARHALLFGYLGTLTAGLSGRLPTAFLDVGDAAIGVTRGLYRATWLLLLPAAALRVGAPLSGDAQPALVVVSGALGAVGLVCLLAVLLRVVRLARGLHRRAAAR